MSSDGVACSGDAAIQIHLTPQASNALFGPESDSISNCVNNLRLLLCKARGFPTYLIHSVTERCNANCKHCFVDKTGAEDELSVEEIRRVAAQVGRNLMVVALGGGEPFLREDLAQIVGTYFSETNAKVAQITTNGSLCEKAISDVVQIVRQFPTKALIVNCSIDGIGSRHDTIRGVPGLFDRVIELYDRLRALSKTYPNLTASVNVTFSKYNQDHVPELLSYLIHNLHVNNIAMTLARGRSAAPDATEVNLDLYEVAITILERHLKKHASWGYQGIIMGCLVNAQNVITRRRILRTARTDAYQGPCLAGRLIGVIRSNGDVYPCELLDRALGNVRSKSFAEIWRGNAAKEARKEIRGCYCTHECFLLVSVLYSLRYAPSLVGLATRMALCRIASTAFGRQNKKEFS